MSAEAVRRGSALLEAGRHEQALQVARQALAVTPDDPDLLGIAGWSLMESDPSAAVEMAEAMIRIEPDEPDGYLLAAHAHNQQDEVTAAADHAERALTCAPDALPTLSAVAIILSRSRSGRGKADDAVRRALARYPEDATAHAVAGVVEMHKKHGRRAAAHFERALAIDPTHDLARTGLAQVGQWNGQLAPALRTVQGQLAEDPADEDVRGVFDEWIFSVVFRIWMVLFAVVLFAFRGFAALRSPLPMIFAAFALVALGRLAADPTALRGMPRRYIADLLRRWPLLQVMVVANVLCAVGAALRAWGSGAAADVGGVMAIVGIVIGFVVSISRWIESRRSLRGT